MSVAVWVRCKVEKERVLWKVGCWGVKKEGRAKVGDRKS